jgi:SprT protein
VTARHGASTICRPILQTADSPIDMSKESFRQGLSKYIPEEAIDTVYDWLTPHRIKLKISKPRTSKLGDFRVRGKNHPAQISVNGNLNPYSFLITLTHEVAHLKDFDQRDHLSEAHGASWKKQYVNLLEEVLSTGAFPPDLVPAILQHMERPKAASCSDPQLLEALRQYDDDPGLRLKELYDGALFEIANGRRFERGPLRRTRYKCLEPKSGRWYLIHGEAEVRLLESGNS